MVASSRKSSNGRKYLGDAADPHFIPTSPIITRQALTYEEEEELTRVCTLVLSGVPHSDDDDEDEEEDRLFEYIKSHAPAAQARNDTPRDLPVLPKASIAPVNESNAKSQKRRCVNADTATPSVASKRDTIDRTNTSTPLTVLSETLYQQSSSRQNSGLRYESRSAKSQAVYGILEKQHSKGTRNETRLETRPSATLSTSQATTAAQPPRIITGKLGRISISHVEYNKSLPSLPDTDPAPSKERQTSGLSRIFENMRKKSDNLPSAASSHPPNTNADRVQTVPVVPPSKRSNFKLAFLFDRKKKQHSPQTSAV